MITRVEISNFQSHKDTVLEFVPGTNVIIGPSDAGKSSVFRAINWVLSNRPLGDAYRSEWGGDTRVALYTSEGNTVERIRTPSRNEYVLNGEVLKAFGTEVPQEVTDALRMDGFNVQAQMDSPFLLAMTPGEAARTLNRAASIDDIDHTIAGLRRAHSKINRDLSYRQEQIQTHQKDLEQYEDLPSVEEALETAEELEAEKRQTAQDLRALKDATMKGKRLVSRLDRLIHVPALFSRCEIIIHSHESLQKVREDHNRFARMVERATEARDLFGEMAYVQQVEPLLAQAEQGMDARIRVEQRANLLRQRTARVRSVASALNASQRRIDQIEEEYHELAPEFCPLCGGRMGDE